MQIIILVLIKQKKQNVKLSYFLFVYYVVNGFFRVVMSAVKTRIADKSWSNYLYK